MTIDENLRTLMRDFYRVVDAEAFEDLGEFLEFPFEIAVKGKVLELHNISDAAGAFFAAARVHKSRGIARVTHKVSLVHATSLTEALIGVDEVAFDSRNRKLISWRSSFLLRRLNGIWRLSRANATGYDLAWEAKGKEALRSAVTSSLC
ncbi:hypothetical protein [Cognatishimia activa]|uniref:SnoaL-like domain-containing protein n=1 Tax=Cognatishimia activa TaxID=1715691 RepID=A0A0P1ITH2_9RHOB|nr:hypothetical protein [Cognatishimia activa]CUI79672.1 hypothetical protein TA5113_01501 [Cognatishimia activa]CUK26853.1 hypothetical protein TA5114_02671 [Cognatishimia activa]